MDEDFHAIPRLSASRMPRVFDCPSSFAREWEAHDLRSRLGVPPPLAARETLEGAQRHRLLAALPFFSRTLGLGRPYSLHEAIRAEAANLGIEIRHPADHWFVYHAVRKRNRLIAHVIERAGPASVERVSVRLDDERLFRSLPVAGGRAEDDEQLSGLPDVATLVRLRTGTLHGVICDYKSGYQEQAPAARNRQLLTLAHLLDHREPLADCHVSLLARHHPPDFLDAALFDRPLLDRAARVVVAKALQAAELARLYRSEVPDPARSNRPLSASLTGRLEGASRVTAEACVHCAGKLCCPTLRQRLGAFAQEELEPRQGLIAAYRGTKTRLKPTKTHPQGKASMTTEELALALGEVRRVTDQMKLFESLDRELSEVARGMLAAGHPLPGVALEEGRQRFALKEGWKVHDAIKNLQTLLPDLNPEKFINDFGTLKAADVRRFVAEKLGIGESDVPARLEESLGGLNPFCFKADQASVRVMPGPGEHLPAQEAGLKPQR